MGIDSVNFPNNSFGYDGKEPGVITQKNDTIKNVLNPDNKIVEDNTQKSNKKSEKEKSEKENEDGKLSFKERWQNFKGKLHKLLHREKPVQKDTIHHAER